MLLTASGPPVRKWSEPYSHNLKAHTRHFTTVLLTCYDAASNSGLAAKLFPRRQLFSDISTTSHNFLVFPWTYSHSATSPGFCTISRQALSLQTLQQHKTTKISETENYQKQLLPKFSGHFQVFCVVFVTSIRYNNLRSHSSCINNTVINIRYGCWTQWHSRQGIQLRSASHFWFEPDKQIPKCDLTYTGLTIPMWTL